MYEHLAQISATLEESTQQDGVCNVRYALTLAQPAEREVVCSIVLLALAGSRCRSVSFPLSLSLSLSLVFSVLSPLALNLAQFSHPLLPPLHAGRQRPPRAWRGASVLGRSKEPGACSVVSCRRSCNGLAKPWLHRPPPFQCITTRGSLIKRRCLIIRKQRMPCTAQVGAHFTPEASRAYVRQSMPPGSHAFAGDGTLAVT